VTGYAGSVVADMCLRLIPRTTARRLLASATIGVAGAGVWAAIGPSLLATAVSGTLTDALDAGFGIAMVIYGALVVGSVVRSTDANSR
jgi:hypothetical protein